MSDLGDLEVPGDGTEPRRAGFPNRPGRPGHCVICDKELTGPRAHVAWYCDEHRGEARGKHGPAKPIGRKASTGKRPTGRHFGDDRSRTAERLAPSATKAPSESRSRVAQVGKVSDAAATSTLSKLLIVICLIFVTFRLRAANIQDPFGERAEALSPTDDEARGMVRPLARWGNSTAVGARVIAPVVRNEDIVLALYDWYSWTRRVNRFIEDNRRGRLAPVQPFRPGGEGQPSEFRAEDQVVQPEAPMAPAEVRYDPAAPPAPGSIPWA